MIIAENYRKLPKKTKRQRQYYKSAKRKSQMQEQERLDHLFELLESDVDNRDMLSY